LHSCESSVTKLLIFSQHKIVDLTITREKRNSSIFVLVSF